ncbi:nucleotide sugar dehydrogenase [Chlorobium phaeovibrioides]|uniref:Nucleotide sugar dehydrogenase n=1 Tax=Chlorobium phaeovibrioides TaxID=1094 RepID=A0A5M8IDJ0_CHLPH|nr:nucleotide sugar dehydrogenase [Chlorobium phaeovibrioides]KAA6232314.1 nucleotide sugar dehydrogenase [Chlorobium phaeovibrioides]
MTTITAQKSPKIAVIGLGYVGLPLAVEFAKHYPVAGFDIKQPRIDELNSCKDSTLETEEQELKMCITRENPLPKSGAKGLFVTTNLQDLADANVYIVTVPTPTDKNNRPDLTPLVKASETVGKVLKEGDIVIYESTVYPGATEEDCVPVLEKVSGMTMNEGFFVGYSPERINPGDKLHTVTKIKKVTSGSTPEAAAVVNGLYLSIIEAGTHLAPSIKVAEAAKVIENSQRDINIAFVNELARIFNRMGIDTLDVLEAASTKWNFLPFKPGLVGGHCIGVDPYYLAQKAQEVGYNPEIILAGRRLNDNMGAYVASEAVKLLIRNDCHVKNAKVLVLGITFKENCPDIRNSRVIDIIKELQEYGCAVEIADPWASPEEVMHEYGLPMQRCIDAIELKTYHAVVAAVGHNEFRDINPRIWLVENGIIYDVKGIYERSIPDARL